MTPRGKYIGEPLSGGQRARPSTSSGAPPAMAGSIAVISAKCSAQARCHIRHRTTHNDRRSVRDSNRPHLRSHRLRAIPRAIGHNHSEDHPLAPLFEKPVRLPPRGASRRRLLRSPGAAEEGQRRGPRACALERAQALR
jgi:hypothetical protein